MQTITSTPTTTGKSTTQPYGFPLRLFAYKKSIEKALTIRPRVIFQSLAASDVQRSDGNSYARVTFAAAADGLWACCDCPAARKALPCYHVAAAALARAVIAIPAGVEIAVENRVLDELTYDALTRATRAPLHLEIVDDEPAAPPTADRFRPAPATHEEREQTFNWHAYRRNSPNAYTVDGWDL